MARRKRVLDDGDSDSSAAGSDDDNVEFDNDPDLRDERELFRDPYKRKRRRKNEKDDAIYGVFGDDSDYEDDSKRGSSSRARTHWTKAPAFVSSEKKVKLEEDVTMEDRSATEEDDGEDDGSQGEDAAEAQEYSDDSEPSRPPSPRVRLEEKDDYEEEAPKPRIGGIGFKSAVADGDGASTGFNFKEGIGARGGIGTSIGAKSGIGARGGIGTRGGTGTRGGIGTRSGIGVIVSKASDETETLEETERVSTPSFSKGGIGTTKSLNSTFGFTSSSTLKTVFLSEDNDSPAPLAPTPTPTIARDDSEPSSSRGSPSLDGMPTAFGRAPTTSNRFKREAFAPPPKPANLSVSEMAHFSKISSSFGSRMLEKMGWTTGTGLGVEGVGIVTPIESKLRPQKMGIAFKGFKEKTEQSKREAKRRGEAISDEEEDEKTKKMRKKVKEAEQKRSDVWKKPKKVKTKVEHKTYEQIIAEAGQESAAAGIGQIIDATGAVPREVSSLSEINLNSWAPTSDPTRIPEIRHNIRLIAQSCKSDLDNLALEAKALHTHKSFVISEENRLIKKIEDEAALISRFQQIQIIANEISTLSKEQASVYEVSLESFSPLVHKLVDQFPVELEKYGLDEVVIAAVAPLVRRMVAGWDPLKEPKEFISVFRGWRKALRVRGGEEEKEEEETQVDIHGGRRMAASPPPEELAPMTPFESLLWNVWLPKVRSTINNEWSPEDPQPAVKLYEAWSTFLPPFIRDNMLDQLVLPKVQKAVADWNPKRSKVLLRTIVFPWLPFVGLRLEDLMSDARRKIKTLLRNWVAGDDIPDDLAAWREVYDKGEWDTITLKYIIPKLSANLRTNFRIDPRNQTPYLPVFQQTLLWVPFIRPSILSQVFETEFFPEWLRILHIWLIQPTANYDEVRRWYQEWRDMFPMDLVDLSGSGNGGFAGVGRGFKRGLELMHEAMALPSGEKMKLKKPDFKKEMAIWTEENKRKATAANKAPTTTGKAGRTQEITFKSIVEEYAANHNLLFMPTGKAHVKSRMPLYRVSSEVDGGKKGVLVYVLDDAVWASAEKGGVGSEEDEFRAISLDEMVGRAMGSSGGASA